MGQLGCATGGVVASCSSGSSGDGAGGTIMCSGCLRCVCVGRAVAAGYGAAAAYTTITHLGQGRLLLLLLLCQAWCMDKELLFCWLLLLLLLPQRHHQALLIMTSTSHNNCFELTLRTKLTSFKK